MRNKQTERQRETDRQTEREREREVRIGELRIKYMTYIDVRYRLQVQYPKN